MRRPSLMLLLLCACGPKGGDTEDTGTAATTSASETTGDTPPTGDGPTTGDELCGDPSVPISPAVEVKITNGGTARAYVDLELNCYDLLPFTVDRPDTKQVKINLGPFEFTCAEAGPGDCGEDLGCPFGGRVTQIEPGASLITSWSGGAQVLAPLSEACADQLCGGCWIDEQVPPGKYTVRVAAGTGIAGCDPDPCVDCVPENGTCVTSGGRINAVVVEAPVDYPAQTAVELVIP